MNGTITMHGYQTSAEPMMDNKVRSGGGRLEAYHHRSIDVHCRTVDVDGITIFYREAGSADAPAILLMHGFPTSSHYFRHLMPLLATRYRVVAPDMPGFGFTETPDRSGFSYTFDHFTTVIDGFTGKVGLNHYALYLFDYGAPVGLRLALAHPDRVTAIVSQNGNMYVEGLGPGWKTWENYWNAPTAENREAMRALLVPERFRQLYLKGASDPSLIAPEAYALDTALLARPGIDEIQLDLFLDYRSNVELYPVFQKYLRDHNPPLLAIWGRHDPVFVAAGAEAFRRDLPDADIRLIEAGHFALETHSGEIALAMDQFLSLHVREG